VIRPNEVGNGHKLRPRYSQVALRYTSKRPTENKVALISGLLCKVY